MPQKTKWRAKHTSTHPKKVLKKNLHEKSLAWHCNNRKYRKATAGHHTRQSVLCRREGKNSRLFGESISVYHSKLPRPTPNVGAAGYQGQRQEQGWRKVGERDHTAARAGQGFWMPGATGHTKICVFLPPDMLHCDPSADSQTQRWKDTRHAPGGIKERPWIYTLSTGCHLEWVYLHQTYQGTGNWVLQAPSTSTKWRSK